MKKIPISAWANHKEFIGVDGEGYTDPEDGIHKYNLLAASDGTYISEPEGLRSKACFDYLLSLKDSHPRATFVSYYFSYDVNMMCRNIPSGSVTELGQRGFCYIYPHDEIHGISYKLEYMPKKMFKVYKGMRTEVDGKRKWKTIQSITIFDVFGFFQKSFVGALKEFKIATAEDLAAIESMKQQRGSFALEDLNSIVEYNAKECTLLVSLMETVSNRLESIGLKLSSWHGAGAVAAALLRREGAKKHIDRPKSEDHNTAVMSAYFGGRINCAKVGEFGKVYAYDIISAYPSIMRNLPSLKGMTERETETFIPNYPYAVYHVKWSIDPKHKITPFPFRTPDGKIDYPYSAEGYYWYYEVAEAMKQFPGQIQIVKGYVFENIDLESRPFDFINEMFEQRKELKSRGDMAQLCVKLGLNSLYGKTAQGIGFRGQLPPFQCYIYAGMITSGTRAMMLSAAMQNEDSVISFATDGIVTQTELDLPLENRLGNWELAEYEKAFVIKPGFYTLGDDVKKVRGFPPSAINFEILQAAWRKDDLNATVAVTVRNFIGMKSRSVKRPWLSWIESPKVINYWPSKGEPELLSEDPLAYRLIPANVCDGVSHIYVKGLDKDYDEREVPEFECDVENL